MNRLRVAPWALLLLAACATHSEVNAGEKLDGALDDGAADADAADSDDAADADAAQLPVHPITPCGSGVLECGDGLDNDRDGLIDSDDPDCVGPCDAHEDRFSRQFPGSAPSHWGCTLDCAFDEYTGSGRDDCLWDVRCDSLSPGGDWGGPNCAYVEDYQGIDCEAHFETQFDVRARCQENCEYRTPNGCDCFGCCQFPTTGNPDRHLLLWTLAPGTAHTFNCTYEEAIKEESPYCAECTPVPSCYKECGRCELCLGKLALPEDCTEEEVAGRCGSERQVCGLPGDEPCEEGFYCLSGCCVDFSSWGGL